ncbi:uncharacterized protein [Primulina huaijiensis]|uniref:uncharacterized protein n=1 Tax=Primulina huaijiensis TaxID=1492673 RepID=UPI003CC710DA
MDFMKIGPPPLTGDDNADVAEAWVDIMEQCFRVLHYDEDEKMEVADFMIQGKARKWWKPVSAILVQQHGRIRWEHFRQAFINHHFPPALRQAKEMELRFKLYEAWERYKELLRRCPNHGFEKWVQIELFYNGLNGQARGNVNAAANGTIFVKSPDQAYELLEQMTINAAAGVYAVDPTSRTAQVSALTTKITAMNKNFGGYDEYRGNPPPNTYHPVLRNPENFSYANNNNVLNPPPVFYTSYGEGKPSFEDLVGTFFVESGKRMSRTYSRLDNLETHTVNIGASLKILESQVGQVTRQLMSQPSGAVSNTADPNLREVNAIFIQHEEIGMVDGEEEKIDPTPVACGASPGLGLGLAGSGRGTGLVRIRFIQLNAEFQKKKGLEDLKNLHTNIQSEDQEKVALTEGGDEGIQRNLPQKLQDSGEFVVPCAIVGQMLADKSVKVPLGFVEDVEVQIDELRLPADFVVLDMENRHNVLVILGQLFFATAGAFIHVKQRTLTMEVEGQRVEIRGLKRSHDPP